MDYLTMSVIIISIIMLLIALFFHFGKIIRHKNRKYNYDILFKDMIHIQNKQCAAIEFSKRCGIYYQTFFFYQFLSKGVNMLCLTLTVFSMIITSTSSKISIISSMLSLICVITIIYLNPSKRAEQYLYAWRLCDIKLYKIICDLNKPENELYKEIDEIPQTIKEAESFLSSDTE